MPENPNASPWGWMPRGLAGLITMMETEARKQQPATPEQLETLAAWRDRLSAVIDSLARQRERMLTSNPKSGESG